MSAVVAAAIAQTARNVRVILYSFDVQFGDFG